MTVELNELELELIMLALEVCDKESKLRVLYFNRVVPHESLVALFDKLGFEQDHWIRRRR